MVLICLDYKKLATEDQPMAVDSESIISIGDENKEVNINCRRGGGRREKLVNIFRKKKNSQIPSQRGGRI